MNYSRGFRIRQIARPPLRTLRSPEAVGMPVRYEACPNVWARWLVLKSAASVRRRRSARSGVINTAQGEYGDNEAGEEDCEPARQQREFGRTHEVWEGWARGGAAGGGGLKCRGQKKKPEG